MTKACQAHHKRPRGVNGGWEGMEYGKNDFRVVPSLCFKTRVSAKPLIWKKDIYSHANKTHFHKKGFALSLTFWNSEMASRSVKLRLVKSIVQMTYRYRKWQEEAPQDHTCPERSRHSVSSTRNYKIKTMRCHAPTEVSTKSSSQIHEILSGRKT